MCFYVEVVIQRTIAVMQGGKEEKTHLPGLASPFDGDQSHDREGLSKLCKERRR